MGGDDKEQERKTSGIVIGDCASEAMQRALTVIFKCGMIVLH